VVGIGKLRRALPAVLRASAPPPPSSEAVAKGAQPHPSVEIGWCERVSLPDLGVTLKAKIDTGARTSALHVISMRPAGETQSGRPLVEIEVPTHGRARSRTARVEVVESALVRGSSGHAERRPVIETTLAIGPLTHRVRVTLTDRGDMTFPMLVGRTALGADVRIHPQRRFLLK
jgi:hypothetical protein